MIGRLLSFLLLLYALGYAALHAGEIDVKDAYSTDAKIGEYALVVLEDDRHFFPEYKAVFLYRLDAPKRAIATLKRLAGTLPETRMIRMNVEAERTKDYALAASLYFGAQTTSGQPTSRLSQRRDDLHRCTVRHLLLVGS